MDINTAVTTWRGVCGSDSVMATMPPTRRMLKDFARRIEAAERERCAKLCDEKVKALCKIGVGYPMYCDAMLRLSQRIEVARECAEDIRRSIRK